MKTQILLVLGILAVLAISGCTGSSGNTITKSVENAIVCTPEWIKLEQPVMTSLTMNYTTFKVDESDKAKAIQDMQESCKGMCYKEYKVTKLKLVDIRNAYPFTVADCYCDVNNC